MIFVTAAVGKKHRALALELDRSMAAHGWPPLVVMAETPIETRQCVVMAEDLGRGRGLKTRWASAIPADHAGPCGWIDADCVATGPWTEPQVEAGEVAAVVAGRVAARPPFLLFHSTVVLAGEAATACDLCDAWAEAYRSAGCPRSDEQALVAAIRALKLPQRDLGTKSSAPLENLRHLGASNPAAGD